MLLLRRLYKIRGELVVPLLFLSYATYYYLEVRGLPRPEINLLLIQPVYLILVVAAVLYLVVMVYRASLATDDSQLRLSVPSEEGGTAEPLHFGRSLVFAVTTVGYIFLISPVGFVTMSLLYLVVLSYLLGVKSWLLLTLLPLTVVGLLYAIMELWLSLSLPRGVAF